MLLRQAIARLVAASALPLACSAEPPGSGQAATTSAGGSAKSTPFRASAGSSFWSVEMIEMRSPSVATSFGVEPWNRFQAADGGTCAQAERSHHHRGEKARLAGRHCGPGA